MSRYSFDKGNNIVISYGIDLPTGGYFYMEEDRGTENEDGCILGEADGLVLTDLLLILKNKFSIIGDIEQLVRDYLDASLPTALQVHVGKMFGKDISAMGDAVDKDLTENFTEYVAQVLVNRH